MIIGHRPVVAALEAALPPAGLLLGPRGVGKATLTRHLAEVHRVAAGDRLDVPEPLSVEAVRAIRTFVATAPFGAFKLVTASLDGAREASLHALLKMLEEPPPSVRFLLVCSRQPLATIVSRCTVYRLGLLRPEELRAILTQHLGLGAAAADRATRHGRGRVDQALAADAGEAARSCVLGVARALATGDRQLYERAVTGVDDVARALLLSWLREALTGQWSLFTPADTFRLAAHPARLRAMLFALGQVAAARPRLAVRTALEPFLATP